MTRMQVEEGVKRLAAEVRKRKYIVAAYLFGSAATGKLGPLSDIDVGFLLKKMSDRQMFKKELELIGVVQSCFCRGEVDVVILNEAPNLLSANILKGRLVESNNECQRVAYETTVLCEHLDRDYHDRLRIDAYVDRVAQRGLV